MYNCSLANYASTISSWLKEGIKIIWFGEKETNEIITEQYKQYFDAGLLFAFVSERDSREFIFTDGMYDDSKLKYLEKKYPLFNAAQYRVEHSKSDNHIIVEASAGTGKTTVMIDRIMFLMHTVPDLSLSDIAMITFTNDAAEQMDSRLQRALLNRYKATRKFTYFKWLEEQSNMTISTIDSFSVDLLKANSIARGLSSDMTVKTMAYERKELIKDVLDDMSDMGTSVKSQLGTQYYNAVKLIDLFWQKATELGLSAEECLKLDWGKCFNNESETFQDTIRLVIENIQERYIELKRQKNAVPVQDIKRDLNDIISYNIEHSQASPMKFKYLFIDEFQDSDNAQIDTAAQIVNAFDIKLFAVGDVKQSIYRFRGAVDSAFSELCSKLKAKEKIVKYSLINNYRTSYKILDVMNKYFDKWSEEGLLSYSSHVYSCNKNYGDIKFLQIFSRNLDEEKFIEEVQESILKLEERIERSGRIPQAKDKVVVLTRSNRQLVEISDICKKHKISAIVKREGTFYISDAVKDFYALINSFVYHSEPLFIFNYLLTPYSEKEVSLNIDDIEKFYGDKESVFDYLWPHVLGTKWEDYHKQFKLKPAISVIKEIFDDEDILRRYAARRKQIRMDEGWSSEEINKSVYAETIQYKANMDKLLLILQQTFKSGEVTISTLSEFLKMNIATNRDESEADITDENDYRSLHCMTVHKAKGLEFDTVILPFMSLPMYYENSTELLLDDSKTKIAWNVKKSSGDIMQNRNYSSVRKQENQNAVAEETRILYVAMTRAINSFKCFITNTKNDNCWAGLIWKAGIDNEQ